VSIHRRQYRLDLTEPVSIRDEVSDIEALVATFGEPVLIAGHSSGAVVALEALAALPDAFMGAVLYEPPVTIDLTAPMGGSALRAAQQAIAENRPGKAIQIFTRDMVGLPAWQSRLVRVFVTLNTRMKGLAPRQIADVSAMRELGVRLPTYAGIEVPVLLVGGDQSPGALSRQLDALQSTLPQTRRALLSGQGHSANERAPKRLADLIAGFYCDVNTSP
jgi:pimeloyl-ACP methyl ester carboxylesterase